MVDEISRSGSTLVNVGSVMNKVSDFDKQIYALLAFEASATQTISFEPPHVISNNVAF